MDLKKIEFSSIYHTGWFCFLKTYYIANAFHRIFMFNSIWWNVKYLNQSSKRKIENTLDRPSHASNSISMSSHHASHSMSMSSQQTLHVFTKCFSFHFHVFATSFPFRFHVFITSFSIPCPCLHNLLSIPLPFLHHHLMVIIVFCAILFIKTTIVYHFPHSSLWKLYTSLNTIPFISLCSSLHHSPFSKT